MIKRLFSFYSLPLMMLVRPINGFYEMKFEKRGTLRLALLNFVLTGIAFAFMNQYTSILITERHPLALNSWSDFQYMAMAVVLFCVSNWAVTSLTDGEGKLKEIFMTVCYAMTPLVILLIPATLFSNILTGPEAAFYHLIVSLAVIWFVLLLFIGLIVVHNYTVTKAIGTAVLTFVSLLVILFLITLFFTLIQQLYTFINSIYRELSFRA